MTQSSYPFMDETCAQQICHWLQTDELRLSALQQLAEFNLPDAWIAAGFVRNLVWDQVHQSRPHSLNDLDVIYFEPEQTDEAADRLLEQALGQRLALPWSVKNQARMHLRNGDRPYRSCLDAMSYWCELQTAVAARWNPKRHQIELQAAFGFACLFDSTVTLNQQRPKHYDFFRRISGRRWLSQWPALSIVTEA